MHNYNIECNRIAQNKHSRSLSLLLFPPSSWNKFIYGRIINNKKIPIKGQCKMYVKKWIPKVQGRPATFLQYRYWRWALIPFSWFWGLVSSPFYTLFAHRKSFHKAFVPYCVFPTRRRNSEQIVKMLIWAKCGRSHSLDTQAASAKKIAMKGNFDGWDRQGDGQLAPCEPQRRMDGGRREEEGTLGEACRIRDTEWQCRAGFGYCLLCLRGCWKNVIAPTQAWNWRRGLNESGLSFSFDI